MASTDPLKTAEDQKRSSPLLKIWLSSLISVARFSLTSEKDEATDGFNKISQHLDFFEKPMILSRIYTQLTSAADFGGIIKAAKMSERKVKFSRDAYDIIIAQWILLFR